MRFIPVDEQLLEEFLRLLASAPPRGQQKEQVVQIFLEEHTELVPTPNLLNHHLHATSIISKFQLSTEFTTDYIYVTKSSDLWRITLVELEAPEKHIFTNDTRRINTTAEFNAALNQVRSWRNSIDGWKEDALRRLEPILRPQQMQRNPVEFNYQLIIGRSEDKNRSGTTKKHFRSLISESGIDIMTFDSLITWYKTQRYRKNVLKLIGGRYEFKYMHIEPESTLAYMGSDCLRLSEADIERLDKAGYDIGQWLKGRLLVLNGKYPSGKTLFGAKGLFSEAVKQ